MSRHDRPEFIAPDDQRCGATVKGHLGWHWEYTRHDHQCPKRANQMRGATPVCHLHAKAKRIEPWSKK